MNLWYWLMMFVWFCIAVFCAVWCGAIAESKGYSRFLFTVLGFLFFLVTLVVVLILPSKRTA